jgi:glycosidase
MTSRFKIKLSKIPFGDPSGIESFPKYNFHINVNSRKKYLFHKSIFSTSGNVVFSDFEAVKDFAGKINEHNRKHGIPKHVNPGEIYAMGLIDEIFHYIIHSYRENIEPGLIKRIYSNTKTAVGETQVENTVRFFATNFAPPSIEYGYETIEDYLKKDFGGVNGEIVEFEELIVLKLANENKAFYQYKEFFDDSELDRSSSYRDIFSVIEKDVEKTTGITVGGRKFSLLELLRAPMRAHPDSMIDQLKYITDNWGLEILGDFSRKLLTAVGVIKEESGRSAAPGGSFSEVVTVESLTFPWNEDDHTVEEENFSTDSLWMPRVVMVAKNVFVWLDQLSKLYAREISTLDQVPDDELKTISKRGFSALWLIGLWERSKASRTIKQLMGNPEAVASAYSLYDYTIAEELGGEKAFLNLKERAWNYGIRIASDMVPNHMAIDSKWVNEHPDWFLSLDNPPYPGYTYNGPDLSSDHSTVVQIEDKYFDKTDAAVTFKRIDRKTGETKYIYHGNDGTCMPWNDTAQLNYLKEEVREKVISTIIEIARNFPIIRFDAAMTLAKRHYHRLWFPEPGSGGDIPSRAEHGMTKGEFNNYFPKEFWREVVDRIAAEVPDTLLLAEAFWLMEGYFVRTLGMHRVYNSAFMNFLKDEDNAKYRESIKNVLQFDPYILERYVNFLNNPDEDTAVKQFGKDDKYFGVTMMMVTMPGLPMFGHGQVEGYQEKYGMEYRRAYWNEAVDWDLVKRHEREIFPLMHKRELFAHVGNFNLFDFYREDGSTDENVFAFTNGYEGKQVLVFYHNKYAETAGWIHTSAPFLDKSSGQLIKKDLCEALNLSGDSSKYVVFRDTITNEQFVRKVEDIKTKGFFAILGAYKYQVFTDFTEVSETEREPWSKLCEMLQGRGTGNLKKDLNRIVYEGIHRKFKAIVNPELFEELVEERISIKKKLSTSRFYKDITDKYRDFLKEISKMEHLEKINDDLPELFIRDLIAVIDLPRFELGALDEEADKYLHENLSENKYYLYMIFGFTMVARLSMLKNEKNCGNESLKMFMEYGFGTVLVELVEKSGLSSFHAERIVRYVRAFVFYQNWWKDYEKEELLLNFSKDIFEDPNMVSILQINEYEGKVWFNKEAFDDLTAGFFVVSVLEILRNIKSKNERKIEFKKRYGYIRDLFETADESQYEVTEFLKLIKEKG